MNTFKLKVLLSLSAVILLIVTALSSVSYTTFKKESIDLNKKILLEKNAVVRTYLTGKMEHYKKVLSSVKLPGRPFNDEALVPSLQRQLSALTDIQGQDSDGTYIFTEEGEIYDNSGQKLSINVKALGRSYHSALFGKNDTFYVSDPYRSAVSNKLIVSMAYKLSDTVAILTAVHVESVFGDLADRDSLFLYSNDGTILLAPYADVVGDNIYQERPYFSKFSETKQELYYEAIVEGDTVSFVAFWGQLEQSGWSYVTFVQYADIQAGAINQLFMSFITGVTGVVLSVVVILFLVNRLVLKPVGGSPEEIAKLIELIAKGQFNQNLVITEKDTGIYRSLVSLTQSLSELIKGSHHTSDRVAQSAQELNVVMEESLTNAQYEHEQVETIASSIQELSATSADVSEKAAIAEVEAQRSQLSIEHGQQTLFETRALTQEISDSFAKTAQIVEELRGYTVEIGSFTDMINGISEQTNLLALNAAIEAARAGQAGRGFAVVADEVRALASKTQQSTVNIQTIIASLQTQSEVANENMSSNVELIKKSVVLTQRLESAFSEISSSVHSISDNNAIVATASQQQSAVTEDISSNASVAFDMVQQNVSAMNQTLQAAKELAIMAQSQKDELSRFKV